MRLADFVTHPRSVAANLAELFKQAQEEKATFLDLNQTLQRKLSEHLRTVKKAEEGKDVEKTVTDQEQRYYKCLSQVNELRDELKRLQQQNSKQAVEMKRRLDDKQSKAEEIKEAFVEFKREILKGAENSRTGKPIPMKLIKSFEEQEQGKEEKGEEEEEGGVVPSVVVFRGAMHAAPARAASSSPPLEARPRPWPS